MPVVCLAENGSQMREMWCSGFVYRENIDIRCRFVTNEPTRQLTKYHPNYREHETWPGKNKHVINADFLCPHLEAKGALSFSLVFKSVENFCYMCYTELH